MGKKNDYQGGSVWLTENEAWNYIHKNKINDFSVYGVIANWNTETERNDHEEFNNLLVDSQLIKLH